ncbi:PEP-CTERM sorting domain-containing protein [Bradyrhizobium manausense]|uniref:PEPxxWA-CTERM sorting domain-containing protein n=1 Tax=Bradyrhizobium manausense TaxID=989370 RepID=UPI001BABC541|nr:PEPxxWA-CTERM sorting domain-containing protein [Bradyrhizobium manausense]MBR0688809.1 PEP-CTERM sorting domain-containing protein [Bradyrhizobium manausense]
MGSTVRMCFALRFVALAALASCAVVTNAATAAAATIVVNGLTEGYHSSSPNGPFALDPGSFAGASATVGHIITGNSIDGYYAALMQFSLPTLPADAVVTNSTLTFSGIGGNRAGDILLTAYATQGTAFDPNKIRGGSTYGVIHVDGQTVMDLTDLIAYELKILPAGSTAGFSFSQAAENCTYVGFNGSCFDILGSSAGNGYPIPTLTISYDVVTTAVPEPSTWAMMIVGFGLLGFAGVARRSASGHERRLTPGPVDSGLAR